MKQALMTLLAIVGCVVTVGGLAACESKSGKDVYTVELTVGSLAALPACTGALQGQVAYVASPSSLLRCDGNGQWVPIQCNAGSDGSVAYANTSQLLVACIANVWQPISLPQGPAGPPGSAGPKGAPGAASLVKLVPFSGAGGPCASGGTLIEAGLDANGDGVLQDAEVTSTAYVCNGATGAQGPAGPAGGPGAPGSSSLMTITAEPAGANCASGGQRIDVGVDANGDGVLEASEVQQTAYVCNGAGSTPYYAVGGTVSGLLAGTSLVLRDNGGDDLTVSANGAFNFSTTIASGGAYAVTIATQPDNGQSCTVPQGAGHVGSSDVTSVRVVCTVPWFQVATSKLVPFDVVAYAGGVYWPDGNAISQAIVGAASLPDLSLGTGTAEDMVIRGATIYWIDANAGTVMKMPFGGGAATTLASGQAQPTHMAIDDANVYWVSGLANSVSSVPLAGGAVTAVAANQGAPGSVASDGTNVYWTSYGQSAVLRAPIGGGAITTIASGQSFPGSVRVEGGNVYWVANSAVWSAPVAGGAATALSGYENDPAALVVDNGSVYWADFSEGTIRKTSASGGQPVVTIASGQNQPSSVAVDATYVYWANRGDATIMAVPR